jgi:type IV pilus assembly protein PilC
MAKYSYIVKDAQGKTLHSELESFDKDSLIKQLQRQGYFIVKIEEITKAPIPKTLPIEQRTLRKFTRRGIRLQDLLTFARQLATMLESGVTLLRSLNVILEQAESEQFYRVIGQVTKEVEQGSPLSEALSHHPKVFNQFWISLVEVGEASGTMPTVLNKLAFYLEQQASFQTTIISAIMYPVILFVICMGAVAFFALFVGPRFEGIFKTMGVELPFITRALLFSFRLIKNNIFWIFWVLVVFLMIFRGWVKTPMGRVRTERFLLGLPQLGEVFRYVVIERFTSQMAILIDSGVPILYALDISQRLVNHAICSNVIGQIKESVRQGELLVAPMERSHFFPPMTIQMISVGEETGELSKMLNHVAGYYQSSVETFMKRLGTLIEPFMLVFMGTIIGIIVLAMFLPMFNIAQLGGART